MSTESTAPTALVVPATIVGSHRGAHHHVAALRELAAELPDAELAIRPIDPRPGRVETIARVVEAYGGKAFPVRARFEDMLPALGETSEPLVLATDSAATGATALVAAETQARWVFLYQLIRLPVAGELLSLRCAIPPGESLWRERTAALLDDLQEFGSSRGAEFVIGERARSSARAAEPRHRAGMANHLKGCMRKIIAGLRPEVAPVTVSEDGITAMPLLISRRRDFWQEPLAMGQQLLAETPLALTRGSMMAIAEATAEGLRVHALRLRTDGRLMVRGRHALDTEALTLAVSQIAAEQAAERQRRRTVSRTNAVDLTD